MSELKKIIDTMDEASDGFAKIADKQQKKMYDEILLLVKNLDTTPDGKIKQSIANLKQLTQIKAKLSKLAKDDEWAAGVGKFLQYFTLIQGEQMQYFTKAFAENTLTEQAKKKHDLMKQVAVQNTIEGLIGTGLQTNVTDPINNFLLRAVTSGAKFADLQKELHDHLMGADGGKGAFARYAGTYATTAMTQFTGQNNKLLTDNLGVEWFMYVGSNKETTREFCEQLTKKMYIHKSEIPDILKGKIDDYQCAIYPKTGLPYGMIDGTNEDNFQCNCGGWNCRHQLVPVDEMVVPASIRARIKNRQKQDNLLNPIGIKDLYEDKKAYLKNYIAKHPGSKKTEDYLLYIEQAEGEGREKDADLALNNAVIDMRKFDAAKKTMENKKTKILEDLGLVNAKIKSVKEVKDFEFMYHKFTPDGELDGEITIKRDSYVATTESGVKIITPKDLDKSKQYITPLQIETALKNVPSQLVNIIKEIRLVDFLNPEDPYWAVAYKTPGFVSFATDGEKITYFQNNKSYALGGGSAYFVEDALYHEAGHAWDRKNGNKSESKEWDFARREDEKINKKAYYVSSYSKSSGAAAEDFADSIKYFCQNRELFSLMYPNRYKVLISFGFN